MLGAFSCKKDNSGSSSSGVTSDQAADIAILISDTKNWFNEIDFRHKIGQLIAEQKNCTLQQMDLGRVILDVGRTAADTGLYVPMELSLLGKTLLQLDQIGRTLAPKFDPNESIRRNASKILNERLKSSFTEGRAFSTLLEAKQFFELIDHDQEVRSRKLSLLENIHQPEFAHLQRCQNDFFHRHTGRELRRK